MRVLLSQRQPTCNPIEHSELIAMTKTILNPMKSLGLLIGALVFTLLFAACSSGASSGASSSQSSGDAGSASPSASASSEANLTQSSGMDGSASSEASSASAQSGEADGSMTLGEYMSGWYMSYDSFNENIQNGTEVPKSLRLIVAGKFDGYVHDKDAIVKYWNELSSIRVDAAEPIDNEHSEEFIAFDFDDYHEVIPFDFYTSEFTKARDGKVMRVLDPAKVDELADSLTELAKAEQGDGLGELPDENGAYLWDADGDGNPEHVSPSIVGNGDEAPNVGIVALHGIITGIDTQTNIDGVYGFERFESFKDDRGPYLVVDYLEGDYYSHDRLAHCVLRLVDGELVVEEAH